MSILVISVNLQCCQCKAKIHKVLECVKEEYCIEKIEYDEKINKVIVRGKFDVQRICKIWYMADKVVKGIEIVDVWPPPPPPTPTTTTPPPKPECELVPFPYPLPCLCPKPPPPPPEQCKCCKCEPPPPLCNCSSHEDCCSGMPPECPPGPLPTRGPP